MEIIREIPARFSKLNLSAKLALAALGLISLFCLCSFMSSLFTQLGQAPLATATYQGADSVVIVTWTPAFSIPTSSITPTSSPAPTRTPLPTSLPTRSFETATLVVLPTGINLATGRGVLTISGMDKDLEYVDIQNIGYGAVFLSGWTLISEKGEQVCRLSGILQPREVLRVWASTGPVGSKGFSCGFLRRIWSNSELDPAVLYNPDGQEVSRYPQPN